MSNASEGIVTPFDPNVKLKGAVNRHAVTCFLDATLFSMFSRLDSFEAMLYNSFDDVSKERLAFLLRLWVNLLRSGDLIRTDVTKEIQESLAECGWADARELHQQDASEAFTFITEKLNLPLLTLKMDIYHTGRQDNDDHKFINERLLEVAIPTMADGEHPKEVRLEDCLEEYFNNRIEVKRYLERRNTLQSTRSYDAKSKGGASVHVETMEIESDALTPLTPLSPMPSYNSTDTPVNRHRAPSIIQERYYPGKDEKPDTPMNDVKSPVGRLRTGSVRKEVLMPAWQFFSLIPWYTDNAPSSDAQVAAHFSSKRPVLGLCLKRYSYTNAGRAVRLNTAVDIPIEIGLPHFIQDDRMDDDGPLYGNFKLSLQSVVCHRGDSVDSGHYVSLVRTMLSPQGSGKEESSHWIRFDDLATQRVSLVDIHRALQEETPYLLFYQIMPVEGDPGNLLSGETAPPPSYSTADLSNNEMLNTGEPLIAVSSAESQSVSDEAQRSTEDVRSAEYHTGRRPSAISFNEYLPQPNRKSLEGYREQLSSTEHRKSASFNNGLSRTLSKLALRGRKSSKEDISAAESNTPEAGPEIHVDEVSHQSSSNTARISATRSISEPVFADSAFAQPNPNLNPSPNSQANPSPTPNANLNINGGLGVGRSRSKREKSRSRLLKPSGKARHDDPDRECIVM